MHKHTNVKITPNALALAATVLCLPLTAGASSLYIGYGQSEQTTEPAPDRRIDFTPRGTTALLSIDVTEQLSVASREIR